MIRWIKQKWCDPVWSAVFATMISAAIGYGLNKLLNGRLIICLQAFLDIIIDFFTFKISLYWVFIITIILIIIMLIVIRWVYKQNTKQIKYTPSYLDYTEDVFDGIPYRWSYINNTIQNIQELCPKCKTPLVYNRCPRCHYIKTIYSPLGIAEIETLIIDNIRRKYQI